ncbi:hypothetical protein DIPPA_17941 [Diplonema papillatum]|nr:hypothetical protein DIPPA_17941 [Diplonema papillatum]
MAADMDQVATVYEGESFYSSVRDLCWDACVHGSFDKDKAVAATFTPGRDRMEPYDACLRRCLSRLHTAHEEISEDFMKNIEAMVERNNVKQAAMGGPPGM